MIHNLNKNVLNFSPTHKRRLMGDGCHSSKKLGGCQRDVSKGARKALLAAGRAFMADGKV